MQIIKLFVLSAIFALSACGVMPPPKVSSAYLKTEDGGFLLNRDARQVRYRIALAAVRNLPSGSVVEAQFENPAGGPPLEAIQPTKSQARLILASPPVTGLKANTRYKVQVKLYADADRRELLDSYTQEIDCPINQASLGW